MADRISSSLIIILCSSQVKVIESSMAKLSVSLLCIASVLYDVLVASVAPVLLSLRRTGSVSARRPLLRKVFSVT